MKDHYGLFKGEMGGYSYSCFQNNRSASKIWENLKFFALFYFFQTQNGTFINLSYFQIKIYQWKHTDPVYFAEIH